jgi:hypothetical protein
MNEFLDLLSIPAERDFPVGQMEARRDALVAAIRAVVAGEPIARRVMRAARGRINKSWLALLGILALGIALVAIGFAGQQQRPSQRGAEALLALAGTAQVVVFVAPRAGWTNSFAPNRTRGLTRLPPLEVGAS